MTLPDEAETGTPLVSTERMAELEAKVEVLRKENKTLNNTILAFISIIKEIESRLEKTTDDSK